MTSSRRRARGGQPAPVSASMTLGLAGFSGAIHPGEEGDTIRQLIHFSRRGEQRRASWTTPPRTGDGGVEDMC